MAEERVQRRLAAILAADVAGYSRLMGEDEEGTLAALTAHLTELIQPCIAEHRGRVVKMTGDGLLAEFASVVDAVRCAVAFQEGMRERNSETPEDQRIEFRIGVNLGDVIVQDDDVYGDGVNIAARLEGLAEEGGISLSEDAYRQIRGKLEIDISDAGEHLVKNISRPIRVYRVEWSSQSPAAARQRKFRKLKARWFVSAAAGAAISVTAAIVWITGGWETVYIRLAGDAASVSSALESNLPIIAVLPFANQSGDENQEYFADGITDEVINALGRFNTLRVIGRNAVLPYKRRPTTRNKIKSELGASYIVEGSVRRTQKRVRISVRLTNVGNGIVLWTDRYNGELSDIFQFQDEIAQQIAGKLATKITRVEGRQSLEQRKPNLGLYDLVLQARAIGFQSTRKANRQFRQLMAKAVEMDPDYASSHALLAEALHARVILGWSEFPAKDLQRGEALARKAIALAPGEPDGHRALGRFLVLSREYDKALNELQRAIEINPSDAYALAVRGTVKQLSGDIAGAIESLELALKYNPMLDPIHVLDLALSYYLARRHEDTIRISEWGMSRFPHIALFNVPAAAAAARLSGPESAKRYVEQIRKRVPLIDVDTIGSNFRDSSYSAYLRDGLRLAGL